MHKEKWEKPHSYQNPPPKTFTKKSPNSYQKKRPKHYQKTPQTPHFLPKNPQTLKKCLHDPAKPCTNAQLHNKHKASKGVENIHVDQTDRALVVAWVSYHIPNSRGHTKAWESISPTQGTILKRGSPYPQLKGPHRSVGVEISSKSHPRSPRTLLRLRHWVKPVQLVALNVHVHSKIHTIFSTIFSSNQLINIWKRTGPLRLSNTTTVVPHCNDTGAAPKGMGGGGVRGPARGMRHQG